jgi:hypothetical protein
VGAGAGYLTWIAIGTVGVATGGTAIAIGGLGMAAVGGALGATGAASGGFGIRTISYPLVSPIFWVPVVMLGLYILVGSHKKRKLLKESPPPLLIE